MVKEIDKMKLSKWFKFAYDRNGIVLEILLWNWTSRSPQQCLCV